MTVAEPRATAVATPGAPENAATEGDEEAQLTTAVIVRVEPSVYVPTAVNDPDTPSAMLAVAGLTAIETRSGPVVVTVV
jgi:hypothetical protein